MLILDPLDVSFGARSWRDVRSLAVSVEAARVAESWSDLGPWCVFADVPERRVRVQIVRSFEGSELAAPAVGDEALLTFTVSEGGSESARQVIARCVVTAVRHEVSQGKAIQKLDLVALSETGGATPIEM